MSAVEDYLTELDGLLQVRGAARRRLLRECRDHLQDAGAEHGPDEAVRRFGPAAALAAAYDTEAAARRGQRSTLASLAGVLAVAGSTLALVHGARAGSSSVALWAVVFFAAAQTAAVAAVLAAVQAASMRHGRATPDDVALLCRRNGGALLFAGLTLFAAGAAVPGQGAAALLLGGPVIAVVAGIAVLRARSLVRRLGGARTRALRSPLADLRTALSVPLPELRPPVLLLVSVLLASAAAFDWDRGEGGTPAAALATAAVEAALVVVGFVVLGPAFGLRQRRTDRRLSR